MARNTPKIPGMVLFIIALVLLSGTLLAKNKGIFSVMLWESDETNVADRINWSSNFTFMINPQINNQTSCQLYISSQGAELNQVIHSRNIFFKNETGQYMFCDDNDDLLLITNSSDDIDKYFKTFFSSKEVDCIEDSDCEFSVDSNCDYEPDTYESCINYHCIAPQVECECYVGEDSTCQRTRYTENDCSAFYTPKQITDQGTCVAGKCQYPSIEKYNCSSFQLFFQKYKWYVIIGVIVLIGGIYYYYKNKQ